MNSKKLQRRTKRRAAAITELAVLLPVLTLLAIGTIEIGRKIMVGQMVINAARDGARRATVMGGGDAACNTAVTNYLSNAGISGATTTIVPSADASASGTAITVSVSVPYSNVSWLSTTALFTPGKVLHGKVTMRKQ